MQLLLALAIVVLPDSVVTGWRVYFAPDSLGLRLVEFIRSATTSLDFCFYNSSRADVVQALIDAHRRGVQVRVITDDSRMSSAWVNSLRGAGIPVMSDSGFPGSSYYMHNKFAIRDLADDDTTNDRLWTGSYNANENELNADFACEFTHTGLARAYLEEFNQMWGSTGRVPVRDSARFHSRKRNVLTQRRFSIEGFTIQIFFGPQDRLVDSITALVRQARRQVFFAIFSFTYQPLSATMIERRRNGVEILGVIDKSGANDPASQYPVLRNSGIPVVIDSVPFGNKVLHEKIMVIDHAVVVAGSANWSNNANFNNDENIFVIFSPDVAKRFYPELITRYREGGGSLPPGIKEQEQKKPVFRFRRAVGNFRCPVDEIIYDSAGRKVAPGSVLSAGLYFQVDPVRGSFQLLIIN